MSGTSSIADQLATLLVELRGRLGADGFTNRRRVVSLVADRLPEAGREIKILGTAIDDGVLDMLEAARGGRVDLEIDRLAAAFEARHGIRSDIARPVVQALAHALGLTGLPSGGAAPAMAPPPAPRQDDWVGASSIVAAPTTAPRFATAAPMPVAAAPGPGAVPAAAASGRSTAMQVGMRWLWRGLGVFGAVIGVLLVIGLIVGDRDEQQQASAQPPQQPAEPQQVVQAAPPPQPQPQQQRAQPQPQPQPEPPRQQTQPRPRPEPLPAQRSEEPPLPRKPGAAPPPQQQQALPQLPPGYDVAALQALARQEREDFGVAPISTLHQGAPHGPTPTSIPGGKLIDTLNLIALLNQKPAAPVALVDALGGETKLPNAYSAPILAQGGDYSDEIQTQMRQQFQNLNRDLPIVTYCADPNCWMSYNAALRFINLGFRNVLWYRGGLWAWKQAGLQTQSQ